MRLQHEARDILVDGERIGSTLIVPAIAHAPVPGILFVHGWGGSQAQYLDRARTVAALGCICLTFDLRGHEGTASQYEAVTRAHNLRDVLAAYDTLVQTPGVDRERVALAGSSYGAYLGAIATTQRPVRWLSLRAPALYKDDGWHLPKRELHRDPEFAAFRRRAQNPDDNRALKACAQFKGDALVVESSDDVIVPHAVVASYVAALVQAHSITHRVIEGADHGLSREPWKLAYSEVLIRWLTEMTDAAPPREGRAAAAVARPAPPET